MTTTPASRHRNTTADSEYMNAAQARVLSGEARTLNGEYLREKTLQILACIESAATAGSESIQVYEQLDKIVEGRLRELGYNIYIYHATNSRDDSYFTVSW